MRISTRTSFSKPAHRTSCSFGPPVFAVGAARPPQSQVLSASSPSLVLPLCDSLKVTSMIIAWPAGKIKRAGRNFGIITCSIRSLRTSVARQVHMSGDTVPGPLAFFALCQQHGNSPVEDLERPALACQAGLSGAPGATGLSDGRDPARPAVAAQALKGPARRRFSRWDLRRIRERDVRFRVCEAPLLLVAPMR